MTVREILTIPDQKLKTPVDTATDISDFIREVLTDLEETVEDSPGIALAAPQIGELVSAIHVDVSQDTRRDVPNHGKTSLINPEITAESNPEVVREGCLSVPNYTGDVKRFQSVTVEALSRAGEPVRLEATGWEAVAFQHEIDHLNGTLFLDRIERVREHLHKRT
ncbi:MAG: peptide deformylase [bacterium]